MPHELVAPAGAPLRHCACARRTGCNLQCKVQSKVAKSQHGPSLPGPRGAYELFLNECIHALHHHAISPHLHLHSRVRACVHAALGVPALQAVESARAAASSTGSVDSATTSLEAFARSSVCVLVALNCAMFALTSALPLLPLSSVQLAHSAAGPAWHQFLTAAFVHTSVEGLAQAAFFIYTFGRLVENSFGHWAVYIIYAASALGEGGRRGCTHACMERVLLLSS